jgi:hypothetical protein
MTTNNATNTSNPITVPQGGTGVATNTTAYAVICAGTTATGAQQTTASAGTAGQVLTSGGSSALPSYATFMGGAIVNQASGSATLAAGSVYMTNNGASLVTYTLPATAAQGDVFIIIGGSSGGWTIAEASGQTVHVGSVAATITTGTVASTNQWDCVTIRCTTANTTFACYAIQGNLTVT